MDTNKTDLDLESASSTFINFLNANKSVNQFSFTSSHSISQISSSVRSVQGDGSSELCTNYIAVSNSEIFNHPYYNYPPVKDPGIRQELFDAEKSNTTNDDDEEYLKICYSTNTSPITLFYKNLKQKTIDLKYCGFSSKGMKAMCEVLMDNKCVESFDLSYNWLTTDACFHLGGLILHNSVLRSLHLTGCRIGPQGARRLVEGLLKTKSLEELTLSYNELGDVGIDILAPAIAESSIKRYDLSHNKLTVISGQILALALNHNETITDLDLSWNHIYSEDGMIPLLKILIKNTSIVHLNLSWNGLMGNAIGIQLRKLLALNNVLQELDISNNRLESPTLCNMSVGFLKATSIAVVKMANNNLLSSDTAVILTNIRKSNLSFSMLDLGHTCVTQDFVKVLKRFHKQQPDCLVIYGRIIGNYKIAGPDFQELLFRRANYLSQKRKRTKKHFGKFVLQIQSTLEKPLTIQEFNSLIKKNHFSFGSDLIAEMCTEFALKKEHINIDAMADVAKRLWPDVQFLVDEMSEKSKRTNLKAKKKKVATKKNYN